MDRFKQFVGVLSLKTRNDIGGNTDEYLAHQANVKDLMYYQNTRQVMRRLRENRNDR